MPKLKPRGGFLSNYRRKKGTQSFHRDYSNSLGKLMRVN